MFGSAGQGAAFDAVTVTLLVPVTILRGDSCGFYVVIGRAVGCRRNRRSIGGILHRARLEIPVGDFESEPKTCNQDREQKRHHHSDGAALVLARLLNLRTILAIAIRWQDSLSSIWLPLPCCGFWAP